MPFAVQRPEPREGVELAAIRDERPGERGSASASLERLKGFEPSTSTLATVAYPSKSLWPLHSPQLSFPAHGTESLANRAHGSQRRLTLNISGGA